eukprot:TRINITY_DN819_c0_g1_i2.p1 TRINITY_DN819_c0_g1~~TRINITY_DN819_c0_g1_i2.p1  ORF type:complete len:327 (+),score=88.31 TRINITY_DN819_c0_g1_i2:130-1110(+)
MLNNNSNNNHRKRKINNEESNNNNTNDIEMSTEGNHPHPQKAHEQPPLDGEKPQSAPGSEARMKHKPDFGEDSYKGTGRLKDKIAVVTGGDSGIGRAVCLAYAREGCDIVCSYLNEHEDAAVTKRVVEQAGKKCVLVPGDLSEEAQCKKVVDEAVKNFGRIDILVNNAAYQGKSAEKFEDIEYERVLHTFKTNIVAMFALCKYAIPHIPEGGSIINTGSIQAYKPSFGILDYASTKGSIVAFTKGLAPHLIEKGIRVNCVAPGPVLTPLIVQSFTEDHIRDFGKNHPMERPAQPVELSPCYVFLASSEARFVNGAILACTGGDPIN